MNFKIFLLMILSMLTAVNVTAENKNQKVFYISPSGSDNSDGSINSPFATIEKARDIIRESRKNYSSYGYTVYLRKGTYPVRNTIEFDGRDAFKDDAPLIIKAYNNEEVRLTGGISVPVERIGRVADTLVSNRFITRVKDKILQLDYSGMVADEGKIVPRGFGRPVSIIQMELFGKENAYFLGRYPNTSYESIKSIPDKGSIPVEKDFSGRGGVIEYSAERIDRWKNSDEAWICGYFAYGFADDAVAVKSMDTKKNLITTIQPTFYGYKSGQESNAFYGFNLLEEIETAGEYFVDKKNKKIYFIPYDTEDLSNLSLSIIEQPLIAAENSSGIHFENIIFECTRGMGVYIEGGSDIHFTSCVFRNIGTTAVMMGKGVKSYTNFQGEKTDIPASREIGNIKGYIYTHSTWNRNCGTDHLIENCEIYNTGAGGIILGGGDRLALERGNNHVSNCIIRNVNRWEKTYRGGINVDGTGNVIDHNEISDCTGAAIYLNGNDHLIEYNVIYNAAIEGYDMGAFYYGKDPSEQGNVLRYNFFHHIGNANAMKAAVYHDDGACGMKVYGNIFYKAGDFAVEIGGGNDITYYNNIFVDLPTGFFVDNRLQNWAKEECIGENGLYRGRLNQVDINKLPYSDAYPNLENYWTDSLGLPKRNSAEGNIFYNVSQLLNGSGDWIKFGNNFVTNSDPGFYSVSKMDFRLRKDSEVFTAIPGFQNVPVEKIGRLSKDASDSVQRLNVYTDVIVNNDFLGVNGVYHGFTFMPEQVFRGMNDTDREREFSRIKSMGLNIARTWFRPDWVCGNSLHNNFDFNSEKMEAFCKWLDKMKELNVDVALQAGWWFTRDTYYGAEQPDTINDPKRYAEFITSSCKYLINERGYENIKYLVLFTEPLNYNSGIVPAGTTQQEYYEKVCRAVHDELINSGLRSKLKIIGPNSGSTRNAQWVGWAADNMNDVIDIYSWHAYNATRWDREFGGWKDITEIGRDKILKTGKPFWIDEYGSGYPDEYIRFSPDYGNYLAQCVAAFTNSGAQTSLIWLLMDELYPAPLENAHGNDSFYNGIHRWGLTRWPHDSIPDAEKPYPAWYAFSMISKYFGGRNGTVVLKTGNSDSLYVTAIKPAGKGMTVMVVNASHKAQRFEIEFSEEQNVNLFRHLYDPANVKITAEASVIQTDKTFNNVINLFDDEIPARGVAVYTTIE